MREGVTKLGVRLVEDCIASWSIIIENNKLWNIITLG